MSGEFEATPLPGLIVAEFVPAAIIPEAANGANNVAGATRVWMTRVDGVLETTGEWFNPILVKECRQALKSRQFSITFFLMLVACWLWSIFSILGIGPELAYGAAGNTVVMGYFLILAFPLTIIVPFMAFRSISSESDDKTFELVAITNLSPRQIVGGKLSGAVLQMLLFFSVVIPCLAFSYLLRGVEMLTIGLSLYYLFLYSILCTVAAIMLATVARDRFWQILVSLGLIIGLFVNFMGIISYARIFLFTGELSLTSFFPSQPLFWPINVGLFLSAVSTSVLFYLAAASQLTFASDNRSTALRVCTVIQHALFVGWMAIAAATFMNERPGMQNYFLLELLMIVLTISAAYWYLMGVFATGENDLLSPRVKRGLPLTFAGRMFLNWLYPGPGRGYLYAVGSFAATAILGCVVASFLSQNVLSPLQLTLYTIVRVAILLLSYLLFYLGLGTLLLRFLQRRYQVTIFMRVLLHSLILLVGIGYPFVFSAMFNSYNETWRSPLMITNPIWVVGNAAFPRGYYSTDGWEWIMLGFGVAVFLLNLRGIAAELRQEKLAAPARVHLEEEQLAIAQLSPTPQPQNPWDYPDEV